MTQGIIYPAGGVTAFVKNVQHGSITMNSETSDTATIDAVVLANSYIIWSGTSQADSFDDVYYESAVRLALTNTTTVTANMGELGDGNTIVKFCVVEFEEGVIKTNQSGVITLKDNVHTSRTATLGTEVAMDKSMCLYLGQTADFWGDNDELFANLALTDVDTVTATRDADGGDDNITITIGYQVVEFN